MKQSYHSPVIDIDLTGQTEDVICTSSYEAFDKMKDDFGNWTE